MGMAFMALKRQSINEMINRIFKTKIVPLLSGPVKQILITRNSPLNRYFQKLVDIFFGTLLLLIVTIIVICILLLLSKMLWNTYLLTPVGQKYIELYTERSQIISDILHDNILYLSCDVTLTSFILCFLACIGLQATHISRYFYEPRGFSGKIIFFGLPLAALVAYHLEIQYDLPSIKIAYLIGVAPTLCVFSHCFESTSQLIPEIGDVIVAMKDFTKQQSPAFQNYREKIRSIIRKINATD